MERSELKKYQVIIQDERNNLYHIGFYDNLNDAIPDVNDFLEVYDIKVDDLTERASTFGPCFDIDLETQNEEIIMVRGFIFDGELLEETKQCLI